MKTKKYLLFLALGILSLNICTAQGTFEAGNKISLKIVGSVLYNNGSYEFKYYLTNDSSATQEVCEYSILPIVISKINKIESPNNWHAVFFDEEQQIIKWLVEPMEEVEGYLAALKPANSLDGFSFGTSSLPGIINYYAEGNHDIPSFPEGMADDSIPGYSDLTPYGPGVVGRTIGPVPPPEPVIPSVFLDTLLSYTRQSVSLGWLKEKRDDDCDDDEQPNDGIAKNIEKRIEKAKKELIKGDSVKVRKELEKLVKKVEKIFKKSEEAEKKKHEREIIMTSEAYALLKYNTEYLIERLPEKGRK